MQEVFEIIKIEWNRTLLNEMERYLDSQFLGGISDLSSLN